MRALPSGTVTFLFTDIEGSTKLLQKEGERYADLLAEHRRVLRDAVTAHGGVEVDTQGDAFFVAFARATDAVGAAMQAQTDLAPGPIRVRMGLHTGEPILTDEGYVGLDVHKGARIASAGHGGQVLLSEATRRLVDADVTDLGLHRLKDLQAPERIFQLGAEAFPPLKSLNQTNLPVQPTPFLGRDADLQQLTRLLEREGLRLLTLTGPGGSGKTRLSLQAAAEVVDAYPGGVSFVPLASLADPDLLVPSVTTTLGLRDRADASAEEVLVSHIGSKRTLLVLDNLEQLLPAAATTIARVCASAPGLTAVVTSREPLRVAGEHEYSVAPLVDEDAVALFVERAQAVTADVVLSEDDRQIVLEICSRLDRLPLALELAAARLRILTLADLRDRLERRLSLLTGGARDAPERQRTLHATIAWSYDLLDEDERRFFERLSVFSGGASLDAALEVSGADLDAIESLIDKSLIRKVRGDGDETRIAMLETIREFGLDRLEQSADAEAVRRAHAEYFLAAAERAEPLLKGKDQIQWLNRFENDLDNLRAALEWWLDNGPQEALRFAAALWLFWYMHGHVSEGRRWLMLVLEKAGNAPTAARAKALDGAGYLAGEQSDDSARGLLEESLRCAREVGSPSEIAIAASHLSTHLEAEERDQARALGEEAVATARAANDRYTLAVALNNLGVVLQIHFNAVEATTALYEESLALRREIGDVSRIALSLTNLGYMALLEGDTERATQLSKEALDLATSIGDKRHMCYSNNNLGLAAVIEKRFEDAQERFHRSLLLARDLGSRETAVEVMAGLAAAFSGAGDVLRGARVSGAAASLADAIRARNIESNLLPIVKTVLEEAQSRTVRDEWDAAWSEGRQMTLDEAIEYATQN